MLFYRGKIGTAEDVHRFDAGTGTAAEKLLARHAPGVTPGPLHPKATARAQVRQGRWVVPCPWCFGAENASKLDPRFYCIECRNGEVGGAWVRVVWPDDAESIEALLAMRPDPRTRNWWPPETVGELLAENDRKGVI